ncbi:Uncharacterised protein [Bordetella pertussis]|nr:Uncharacterised protein [Bordetella pertussis]
MVSSWLSVILMRQVYWKPCSVMMGEPAMPLTSGTLYFSFSFEKAMVTRLAAEPTMASTLRWVISFLAALMLVAGSLLSSSPCTSSGTPLKPPALLISSTARRVPLLWASPYEAAGPVTDSMMPMRSGVAPAAACSSFWPQPARATVAAIDATARVRGANAIMMSL